MHSGLPMGGWALGWWVGVLRQLTPRGHALYGEGRVIHNSSTSRGEQEMKHLFRGGRRKVAAVMAVALVASLSQVAPSSAAEKPKAGGTLSVGIFDSFPGYCTG